MPGWQTPSLRQVPGDCWLTWRAGRSHSGRQHQVSPPPTSAAPSPPLELPPGPCNNNRLTHGLCFVYDLWILRWGNYFSIFRLNLRKLSETTTSCEILCSFQCDEWTLRDCGTDRPPWQSPSRPCQLKMNIFYSKHPIRMCPLPWTQYNANCERRTQPIWQSCVGSGQIIDQNNLQWDN